jgi:hypothetical protein
MVSSGVSGSEHWGSTARFSTEVVTSFVKFSNYGLQRLSHFYNCITTFLDTLVFKNITDYINKYSY